MNFALLLIYVASAIAIVFIAPDTLLTTIMDGCENTLNFLPVLFASYCVWLPVIKILEKSGASKKVEKLLLPLNKFLFPLEKEKAYEYLSVNVSSNLLGIGGASTPSGLKAMENMSGKKNKIMLVVLNSLSLQLIPTTVIAMRASGGSKIDVVLPTLLTTLVTTIIGVTLVKIFVKK